MFTQIFTLHNAKPSFSCYYKIISGKIFLLKHPSQCHLIKDKEKSIHCNKNNYCFCKVPLSSATVQIANGEERQLPKVGLHLKIKTVWPEIFFSFNDREYIDGIAKIPTSFLEKRYIQCLI